MKQSLRILYCVITPSVAIFMFASYIYLSYTGAYTPTTGKTVVVTWLFTMSIATSVMIGYFGREQEKQELLGVEHHLPSSKEYQVYMKSRNDHELIYRDTTYCEKDNNYYYLCSGGLLIGSELLTLCDYADEQGFKPLF